MKAGTPARRRNRFFLTVDTELWDDDALWELPVKERKRVKSAMIWGRPLPPVLARVAVQHAPMLQTQAWYGYFLVMLGVVFAGFTALAIWTVEWPGAVAGLAAVAQLLIGATWLRAVRRARRATREQHWPERRG
jgi:hypothetical protein